jgi:hypothetical protein
MAKKFNLKMSNQKELQSLVKVESVYNIDYDELNIDGKEKEELIKYENDITFHREKSMQHIFKFSRAIYEANSVFSKKGNGNFGKWIEKVGIDRDSANIAIRKYRLYLETENKGLVEAKKVLTLTNRTIKALTGQKKSEFSEAEVIEVINAENSSEKLKEIEERKETVKLKNINEKKIFLLKEKIRRQHQIDRLKEEMREIENELQEIRDLEKRNVSHD